jgi:hypothetical protein
MMAPSHRALATIVGLLLAALAAAYVSHTKPVVPRRPSGAQPERMRLAERIYREGVLPSGGPLRGLRADGAEVAGAQAACVQCHRRSGWGTVEGNRIIPPITGAFLYQLRAHTLAELDARHTRGPDLAHALGRNRTRPPYTDETLRRAIRDGVDSAGRPLDALMPRYVLDATNAQLLADYLQQLSEARPPGVTADTIHFATVVAPGVDPARRAALLDVLSAFFAVRNAGSRLEKLREQRYAAAAHRSYRQWQLHVWDLTGAPETWGAQLAAYAQRQPVFALLSGVSDGAWEPVQAFCEQRQVPCWFPTVDLPAAAATDFYSLYFFNGVLLEAALLARRLDDQRSALARVIEIRGNDAAAAGAAKALERALERDVRIEERVLGQVDAATLRAAIADATPDDAIVFWLRPADVARLADLPAPRAAVYFSATLAGGEHAPLPPAWKRSAQLLYPFELPDARRANLTRFHAWLETRGLPLVDERLQSDAYLASLLVAEKIDDLDETLSQDRLVERAEAILSMHLATGSYHRLSLGPGQRFASKGGYLTRFATSDGSALIAETPWITP